MSDMPRVTTTTSSTFKFGHKVLAGQVQDWVNALPIDAEITVSKHNGDPRDPTETTFTATFPAEARR